MTAVPVEALFLQMAPWVVVAIAIAVAATYWLRPKVRDRYPGGKRRYLAAIIVQAAGFMAPIPIVLVVLLTMPIWPGFDVLLAVATGVVMVMVLRVLPVTGPLLRDLAKVRLDLALERVSRIPK